MIMNDLKKAMETAATCVVCGRYAEYRGMYIPDDPGHAAPAEGTTRHVFYGICGRHIEMARLIGDRVGAQFERDFGNNQLQ